MKKGKHGELVTVTGEVAAIQYGKAAIFTKVQQGIGTSAVVDIEIRGENSAERSIQVKVQITGSVEWLVEFFGNPDVDDDGTALAKARTNITEPAEYPVSAQYGMTVNSTGTKFSEELVPATAERTVAGTELGGFIIGGDDSLLCRITNIGGAAGDVGVRIIVDDY
jgi:hypothetical protein